LRFIETLTPMANIDPGIFDYLDTDVMVPGLAQEIGVKESYLRDTKEVQAMRLKRAQQQQETADTQNLTDSSQAYLNIAKGNQVAQTGPT
jgi:hypothetical protein